MEYGTSGKIGATYEYGTQRESMSVGSKVNYYGYDGRGNVSELMNAIGGVNMSYSYGAFGKTSTKVTTYTKNSYTYNGENVDLIPGVPDLQYLRARYYDPNMGRFMQQDTLFGELNQPLTQNLYIYCLNNGVNLRDPSGNSSIADLQAQYDRAQRAGAGQSVLDGIKSAMERARKAESKPTPKPTTKPPKKPDWGDTSNPYNPVNNPNSAGSILSGADNYWSNGGGSSSSGGGGSGNPSDIPHGGISGKFDETATKKIASSKYGDYFDDKIKVASPVMGLGVAVTQFDTPLLGPADAVGGLIILGALGTASTIALIDYLTGKPIIFDDKSKAPASPGKLQGEVEKGRAPRDVERVDPASPPNFPDSQPHVHFKNGTSQNIDGSVHDKKGGIPNPSNKTKDWLEKNGWKVN